MIFNNRIDAGQKLLEELLNYSDDPDAIVVGLPRGGVPVAAVIANGLHLPLDIVCPRKIGAPFNPEFAIGAITETGEGIFNDVYIRRLDVSQSEIDEVVAREKVEAKNRLHKYRDGLPPRDFKGKTIIIADDGLATGSTMKAAIKSIRGMGADKIVVAIPVSPPDTLDVIRGIVDEVVCLQAPLYFQAVGEFYRDFSPTHDAEVIELMHS